MQQEDAEHGRLEPILMQTLGAPFRPLYWSLSVRSTSNVYINIYTYVFNISYVYDIMKTKDVLRS
jgi:hypothetical protein